MSHGLVLIPFILVVFSCVSKICEGIIVDIYNGLDHNLDLTFQCKSKDGGDLGVHVLHFNQRYTFSFPRTATSLYTCSFRWDQSEIHWYDVFKPDDACSGCLWRITAQGPCLFNGDTGQYDLCKQWKINGKLHD
ncbi:Self-incompatibility protein [Parasponia andersonii]|uniref:S-protein homolog n=1 Tax=Parasponia andersonii TaxID=3476 RepID=A0A2P5CAN7_PARAD|nr:Self-incompatibility protein [Parasponia andersonii]